MGDLDLVTGVVVECVHCHEAHTIRFLFGFSREAALAKARKWLVKHGWVSCGRRETVLCPDCAEITGITLRHKPVPRRKRRRRPR